MFFTYMFFKRKSLLFVLLLFVTFFGFYNFANASITLTNEQLMSASENGMVQAICFVMDLLTGTFARVIFAFSVVAIGWLFLLGEIKDYKLIFFFVLAVSVTLGSVNIANVITGNNYSCNIVSKTLENNSKKIKNKGTCVISEDLNTANYYSVGQTWYFCEDDRNFLYNQLTSSSNEKCVEITNNTRINSYVDKTSVVYLDKCQEGYFKNSIGEVNNPRLIFTCEDGGFRIPKNKSINSTLLSDYALYSCKKACDIVDLKNFTKKYNINYSTLQDFRDIDYKNIAYIPRIETKKDNNDYKYYTQGYKFNANCKDGYKKYLIDNSDTADITYTLSKDQQFVIECSGNGTFTLQSGDNFSCQKGCDINVNNPYRDKVNSWKLCTDKSCKDSIYIDDKTNFDFNSYLKIDSCSKGYSLDRRNSADEMSIKCSSGSFWTLNEQYNENNKLINKNVCIKKCLLSDIPGINVSNFEVFDYSDNKYFKDPDDDINSGGKRYIPFGYYVLVTSCNNGYSNGYEDSNVPIKFVCSENGRWVSDKSKYNEYYCRKDCEIKNFLNIDYIYKYNTYRKNDINRLKEIYVNKKEEELEKYSFNNSFFANKFENNNFKNSNITIKNNTMVELVGCNAGFSFDTNKPLRGFCNNGNFTYENPNNYCKRHCSNSEIFKKFGSNVISIINKNTNETIYSVSKDSSISGSSFEVKSCTKGYYTYENDPMLVYCDNGVITVKNEGKACVKSCNIESVLEIMKDKKITTLVKSNEFGEIIDESVFINNSTEYVNTAIVNAGSYFSIKKCDNGNSLLDNKSAIFKCELDNFGNPKFIDYRNSDYFCKPGCNIDDNENSSLFENIFSFVQTDKFGSKLANTSIIKKGSNYVIAPGSYISIESCSDGYSTTYNDNKAIFRCSGTKFVLYKNQTNFCDIACKNNDISQVLGKNIKSFIQVDNSGIVSEKSIKIESVINDDKSSFSGLSANRLFFKIFECNYGCTLSSVGGNIAQCYDGEWKSVASNNAGQCLCK